MEEVVGPDAQGNYSYVVDGQVVQTWNPATSFGAAPVRGKTSTFDASGNPLPPQPGIPVNAGAVTPQTMDPNAAAAAPASSDDWYAAATPSRGAMRGAEPYPAGGGYQPVGGTQQPWFSPPPPGFGGTIDPMGNIPAYRDGSIHPSVSGIPRIPGGGFATPNDGVSGGRSIQGPSGWAGPGSVGVHGGASISGGRVNTAPSAGERAPQNQRSFNDKGHPIGGGGSAGSDVRSRIASMRSRLLGGGGGSSSGGSYKYPSYSSSSSSYPSQNEITKAQEEYQEMLEAPLPVHGWAERQGYEPGTIEAVLGNPAMILPDAVKGYTSHNTFSGNALERQPMTDLALISFGSKGKGLTTKTPIVQPPSVLKQIGYEPIEPDYERILDPSAVTNRLAKMWKAFNSGKDYTQIPWMDRDNLIGDMAKSDSDSILHQNLEVMFKEDPNAAMESVANYFRSAFSAGPSTLISQALVNDVDHRMTNMGGQLLKQSPEKADKAINMLAKSYRRGRYYR